MPHPVFPPEEFTARLARLRGALAARGVAAAIFDEIEAMAWLSGYGSSLNRWRCLVVPLIGEPFILIRAHDAAVCRARASVVEVIPYRDWEDPLPALAAALARRGLAEAAIGLDLNSYALSVNRHAALAAALPGARLVDLGPLANELRLIKSPAEIALLRRAAGIADAALARAAATCRPGATRREVTRAAMDCFLELGADPAAPGPIAAVTGWDFLHGELDDAPLRPGGVVHIELTPRIAWYSARIMRCVSIGPPELPRARAAAALAALQARQIAAMRPGAIAAEVDAILRQGVVRAGLRASYDNITGHTLGLHAPQAPRTSDFTRILHPEANWPLEAGMVFHVHASAGGAALSETVLVTEQGPELLTGTPPELLIGG
ncbi:Xaa-Pro peptidase family protein [Siccirubricoccus sp. KC 17139]|uniref:Xaa-Pro peptidase family protein n=1 Tax=Siccirubricoccus soli TaxID=2899147 RepID=A0ABT1D9C2_9PROT|nr:Xaa-Pro peptidase family protein [Siccirubricoccus soli]MCO6418537.1 Xaa-Pro peptidase family protein [Siccirubricoccus soli]MCP2684672.1 Xaa-Pro peptidase family protein [Siccirubricoccus soli]